MNRAAALNVDLSTQSMTKVLFCSLGHPNPTFHRFCQQCGERLMPLLEAGTLIRDRYRVISELGRGGFGQSFLAADENRFGERCVLKVFAPEVNNRQTWSKAQELFKREADVLYRLEHPQIPKFREWFTTDRSLYLVQDFVAGQTYQTLLKERLDRGQPFKEGEIVTFLRQALPILTYIHNQGMIHRDISPDNLIQRLGDCLPVLIDFGGVKDITVSMGHTGSRPNTNRTLIGKRGYAPDEQIRQGRVSPASDIYALGVTALSLLVGDEPHVFFDPKSGAFNWQAHINLKPELAAVLEQMIATHPADRYGSAERVLQDLNALELAFEPLSPQPCESADGAELGQPVAKQIPIVTQNTKIVTPKAPPPKPFKLSFPPQLLQHLRRAGIVVLVAGGMAGVGVLAFGAVYTLLRRNPGRSPSPPPTVSERSPIATPTPRPFSRSERDRKAQFNTRVRDLKLSIGFVTGVTDEAFFLQYPDYPRRPLTTSSQDDERRAQWDTVSVQVLDVAAKLSPGARAKLGRYRPEDRQAWDEQLRQAGGSPQAFYEQVTQQLEQALPMYQNQALAEKRAEQLWYALAADRLQKELN